MVLGAGVFFFFFCLIFDLAGTPQYEWMERDLAAARPHASWIVLTTHRPIFSSDSFEHEQHIPGSVIPTHLEPLFLKYKVDLVVTGHCHFLRANLSECKWNGDDSDSVCCVHQSKCHLLCRAGDRRSVWQ